MSTIRFLDAIVFAWNLMRRNSNLVIGILVVDMMIFYSGYFIAKKFLSQDPLAEIVVSHLVFLGLALIVLLLLQLYVHLLKYKLIKLSYKSTDTFSFVDVKKISWIEYKRYVFYMAIYTLVILLLGLVLLIVSSGLTLSFFLALAFIIIPGVIVYCVYILAPYIAMEHPTGKLKDIFAYSKKLTSGTIPSLFLLFAIFGISGTGLEALPLVGGVSASIFHLSFGAYTRLFVFFDLIQQDKN